MRCFTCWLLLQLIVVAASGQHTLSGIITGNGEPLSGAGIVIEKSYLGVTSDQNGRFEFKNLRSGTYRLKASFMGYNLKEIEVTVPQQLELSINLTPTIFMTPEVLISATRAKDKTPIAHTNIGGEEIKKNNYGQDIPYLLQLTPSFVATSDAGTGIGYSKFRIRGSDMNRINVTVNGIPLNDAESHGTWFVDQPDLASSIESIQIQRGVGTSSTGAAAFGATINLQTNGFQQLPYTEYNAAGGSFNTIKNSISAGTGLMKGHYTMDIRLSKINSDGFIDRGSSDLKSLFISGGYFSENTVLKINMISGIQTTYQAWNGVPSVRLNNDYAGMKLYEEHGHYSSRQMEEMLNSNSRTYNLYTYDNQIDYYVQNNYQLHFSHQFTPNTDVNISTFYTTGNGYYENFKENRKLKNFNIPPIIVGDIEINRTDMVYRKWLDNHFYGTVFSVNYNKEANELTLGGGWNEYDGNHFGDIVWASMLGDIPPNFEWYRNKGVKNDFNIFAKYNFKATDRINIFADLQYRHINYKMRGIDDDLQDITQSHLFNFFNPKFGIYYSTANNQNLYLSFAVANREPNRVAFKDAISGSLPPRSETLFDTETGYEMIFGRFSGKVNLYLMNYKDQLVLTGQINNMGKPIMVNVDKSYRAGIELQAGAEITSQISLTANATLSRNKIKNFTEYVDNWSTGGQEAFEIGAADIAFSPDVIGSGRVVYTPFKKGTVEFISSYVGRQYIDNSSSSERQLDPWFVNNIKASYSLNIKGVGEALFQLYINNIFNEEYESDAWVYSYILDGQRYKTDGYFPQANRNFLLGLNIKF